jgi:Tfp pilus assembly protein PilO
MSRIGWVLVALLCVLLGVGWFFLLYQPTAEDIQTTRDETENVQMQAQQQRQRAEVLRQIRLAAPEAEADLAFGRTVIPEDPAIPALFRQLQQAADESGVRMTTISPGTPSQVEAGGETIAEISVTMSVEGSYFQLVDMARRIEDPQIVPRALRWQTASVSTGEYPILNATLSGRVYARSWTDIPEVLDEPEPEEAADPENDSPEPGDGLPTDDPEDGDS